VNAVDHLGTVAYKLTDLLEQQSLDVSTMDLKVATINQVITFFFICCALEKRKPVPLEHSLRKQSISVFS